MHILLLALTILIAVAGYQFLYRSRFVFSERFGFIVSKTGSMLNAMMLAIQSYFVLPSAFLTSVILNVTMGVIIGIAFGLLVNSQSLIVGIFNGGVGALMGTMVGAVAENPEICSIPSQFMSDQLFLFFGVFSLILHSVTMFLLCYALRV